MQILGMRRGSVDDTKSGNLLPALRANQYLGSREEFRVVEVRCMLRMWLEI